MFAIENESSDRVFPLGASEQSDILFYEKTATSIVLNQERET